MHIDSKLQNIEVRLVAAVAATLIAGVAFVLAEPFSAHNYGVSDFATTSQRSSDGPAAAANEWQPALLEPALRSLDGVAHHG